MASGIVHSASMSSTITANNEPLLPVVAPGDAPLTTTSSTATAEPNNGGGGASNNNNNNNNNNNSLPRPPSILAESRDTSLSSRNTRDSLRKSVTMRSGSFTESERLFLEQLTVEGTDREVETALRVVEDPDNEDLFFFGSQEQQQQQQQDTKGAGRKREEEDGYENEYENDDIGLNVSLEDDATRDGVAASVATTERRGLESSTATSTITATATATATTNITATTTTTATTTSSLTSSSILGSQRRREVLERRRSESSYNLATIWRAHQTGLAITHSGSRRSLLRRESSISSIGTNASGSGLSVVFGTKAHPGAVRDDVFRSDNNSKSNNNNYNNNNNSNSNSNSNRTENDQNKPPRGSFSTPPKKIKPKQPRSLPTRRPPPFRRSKSVTIAMLSPRKGLARIPEPKTFDPRALSAKPERHRRTQSVSIQRKSVTFHHIDEELEFDSNKATAAIDAIDAVDTAAKRPAALRRSVSDSQIAHPGESKTDQPSLSSSTAAAAIRKPAAAKDAQQHRRALLKRESSMNSIPSIRHGAPVRQDSISSIPSLHHGNPLRDSMSVLGRQSSTASFPSLHPGNPLHDSMSTMFEGDASVATFASLHHGNPLHDSVSPMGRRTSTASFPSLHHGNPLHDSMSTMGRQTSIASIPSIHHGNPLHDSMSTMTQQGASFASLRHANPIRQESVSTIPSLHHARPIRLDSVASLALSSRPSPMSQDAITQRFGVSDEVALAWVQSDESKDKEDAKKTASVPTSTYYDCTRSIPHNVTMPTVASSTDWEEKEKEKEKEELSSLSKSTEDPSSVSVPKPVLMRQATRNTYEGEGVEVQELCQVPILDDEATETQTGPIIDAPLSESDSYYHQYRPEPNVFRTMSLFTNSNGMIRTAGSFDDISLFSSFGKQQRTSDVFRDLRRSLSDENMSTISTMFDQHKEFLLQIPTASDGQSETFEEEISDNGSTSWEMEFSSPNGRFDAWNILQDDYVNGYGGAGTLGFRILGTSADDESCQPHVLSPPLMESLQAFLPCAKSGQNFYMKYSMIRDGASLQTLLRRARGVNYSILAIETIDGEVFGSFTGQAWRKSWNYFGTGESFLWRMRHSRLEPTNGILEQAQKESEIDVYPYTGENGFIQLCTHDRIAVGGGMPDETETSGEKKFNEPGSPLVENSHDWGFGLALQSDLLQGSSSPCVTFGSPSLCKAQPSGSRFEVINVELWTTTPCMTEEDAERLELGKLFLGGNSSNDSLNDAYLPGNYTY